MSINHLKSITTYTTSPSNIVSLEHINTLSESLFQKPPKRGKLFKGPNWTAYTKENLGSIPCSIEKSLISDNKGSPRVGFSTQSDRFFPPQNLSKTRNPGPGSYNIENNTTRTTTSFHSCKGLGNGFISTSNRFNTTNLYYGKYTPGPGSYSPENTTNIQHNITKSMLSQSLYTNKKTYSLQRKKQTPGPGHYTPLGNTFDYMNSFIHPLQEDSNFKSTVNRFASTNGVSANPGPGKYFKDEMYVDYNDKSKQVVNSYYFMNPVQKRIGEDDIMEMYDIKTKQMKEDVTFKLRDKKGKVVCNGEYELLGNNNNRYVNDNVVGLTKKDLFKLRNKTFIKDNAVNDVRKQKGRMMVINGKVDDDNNKERDCNSVEKSTGKGNKKDLFELNRPRWKKNAMEFKVPGPAYYHPCLQQKMRSFNKNKAAFIWTPGVINEDYEE